MPTYKDVKNAVSRLETEARSREASESLKSRYSSDKFIKSFSSTDLHKLVIIERGVIHDSIPYLKLYRVAMENGSIVMCTNSGDISSPLFGVSSNVAIPNGATVLVIRYPGATYGVIIAVEPDVLAITGASKPDELVAGSNIGFVSSTHTRYILASQTPGGGGIRAWKDMHLDAIPGDWVQMSKTGLSLFLDNFIVGLRANEYCGVWANYLDSLLRIAGFNYQLWTGGSEEFSYTKGIAFLKYSGYGYSTREQLGQKYPIDAGPQPYSELGPERTDHPYSRVSNLEHISVLGETDEYSRLPQHRVQRWEGLLGQGGMQWIFAPKKNSKGTFPLPVAQTGVTSQGFIIQRSAKGILISKYPFISAPVRIADPEEDIGNESTATEFNKVNQFLQKSIQDSFAATSLTQYGLLFRNVLDIQNIICNWDAQAGFYTFPKKFKFITETELNEYLNTALNFSGKNLYSFSSIYLDPFGDIEVTNGSGSSVILSGKDIIISAKGSVHINAGEDVVISGKNIVSYGASTVGAKASDGQYINVTKNGTYLGGNVDVENLQAQTAAFKTCGTYNERGLQDVYTTKVIVGSWVVNSTLDKSIDGYEKHPNAKLSMFVGSKLAELTDKNICKTPIEVGITENVILPNYPNDETYVNIDYVPVKKDN